MCPPTPPQIRAGGNHMEWTRVGVAGADPEHPPACAGPAQEAPLAGTTLGREDVGSSGFPQLSAVKDLVSVREWRAGPQAEAGSGQPWS